MWILGIVDLVSDIVFTLQVFDTLRHIKDDPVGCNVVTSPEFFSRLLPMSYMYRLMNSYPMLDSSMQTFENMFNWSSCACLYQLKTLRGQMTRATTSRAFALFQWIGSAGLLFTLIPRLLAIAPAIFQPMA